VHCICGVGTDTAWPTIEPGGACRSAETTHSPGTLANHIPSELWSQQSLRAFTSPARPTDSTLQSLIPRNSKFLGGNDFERRHHGLNAQKPLRLQKSMTHHPRGTRSSGSSSSRCSARARPGNYCAWSKKTKGVKSRSGHHLKVPWNQIRPRE